MKDTIIEAFGWVAGLTFFVGYTLGPIFGLYTAVIAGSFFHACLSLLIPFYGIIYWLVA